MWPNHCVQGTDGCKFHPDLERAGSDVVVQKGKVREVDSYSGFGDASEGHEKEKTELEHVLREKGVTDVFVAGLAADFCVAFTAKDAAKAGFRTYLVRDGTRGITEDGTEKEWSEAKGLGVQLIDSSEVPSTAVDALVKAEVGSEELEERAEGGETEAAAATGGAASKSGASLEEGKE